MEGGALSVAVTPEGGHAVARLRAMSPYVCQKRPTKETYIHQKRPTKEMYRHQKWHIYAKRKLYAW